MLQVHAKQNHVTLAVHLDSNLFSIVNFHKRCMVQHLLLQWFISASGRLLVQPKGSQPLVAAYLLSQPS